MAEKNEPVVSLIERQGMTPDGEVVEELEIRSFN